MWRTLHSLLSGNKHISKTPYQESVPPELPAANRERDGKLPRTAVIALIVSEQDREVLTGISRQEAIDLYFPKTRVEAWDDMSRLSSPVILYDRDWPNAEWRTTVHSFATSPQRPCVILTSRVADEYLWQELIRWGGHDLVAKPLRPEDVSRSLKLALSYWNSARAMAKK